MKFIKSKKALVLLATLVVAVAASIGAYAYFTSTGHGTGSATVGSAASWSVDQTGVTNAGPNSGLFPDASIGGANVQTNAYHVLNNGHGSQYLTQVDIKVANADGTTWTLCKGDAPTDGSNVDSSGDCTAGSYVGKPACKASDFSIDGIAVGTTKTDTALAGDFTAGQDKTTGSVTVEMIDNTLNQDNCQGASVPLYFFAS